MRVIIIVLIVFLSVSCDSKVDNKSKTSLISVDALTSSFLNGWNTRDSAAIMNCIAADAIVMNDSLIHTGQKAIAANWVSGGVRVLSNLKTSSLIKNTSDNLAYDAGTYSLDLTPPGGPVLKEKGNYSLVWTRQVDENWKLTLVHIEDITRMPDIK